MTSALRAILVDDEPLARLRLRTLLLEQRDVPVELVAEADHAQAALDRMRAEPVDVAFVDIRMPGRDGLQLAHALRMLERPPAVVIVSAHGQHALRAFELDVVDYLTKPVARQRLADALQRVLQRRLPAPPGNGSAVADDSVLVVAERGRVLRVPVREVLVLKAEMKYVTLRTEAHSHVLDDSLTDLEQRLGEGFIRIHRNALVAKAAVRELQRRAADGEEGWAVRVAPIDEWLPVSRRQVAAVREALAGEAGA